MSEAVTAEAEVRDAEERRCRALVALDIVAIEKLLRHDLVHIHATGAVDDKTQYLDGLVNRIRFEQAVRQELTVRVFGDTAVATGLLDQTIVSRTTEKRTKAVFTTTQVWIRERRGWSLASFHASRPT